MKAIDFMRQLCGENLDLEQCGIAQGERINSEGPYRYFGANSSGEGIRADKDYFYWYGDVDYYFGFMDKADFVLPMDDTECVYLWEIE